MSSDLATIREENIDKAFGLYLRDARRAARLSPKELALAAGLKVWRVRTLERGNVQLGVRPSEIALLAKALGIDADRARAVAGGVA